MQRSCERRIDSLQLQSIVTACSSTSRDMCSQLHGTLLYPRQIGFDKDAVKVSVAARNGEYLLAMMRSLLFVVACAKLPSTTTLKAFTSVVRTA